MSYPFTELAIENGSGARSVDCDNGLVTVPSHPSRTAAEGKPTAPTRVVRAFLYVLSTAQLFTAFIGPCVIFAKVDGNASFLPYPTTLSVLVSNAFLGVCGGLGLVVANGMSRVLTIVLIPASMLVSIISVIVINTMVKTCSHLGSRVYCGLDYSSGSSNGGSYTESEFGGLLANEALILTFTVLSIVGTSILLCLSFIRRNNFTL